MTVFSELEQDMCEEMFLVSAPYWREHLDMKSIFLSATRAFAEQQEIIDRYVYSELTIETATDWGLSLKEDFLGLRDGIERSLDARKSRLRATLRGNNVTTIEDLEALSGIFTGGLVDITIKYDEFIYEIEFRDLFGIPERIEDVQAVLSRYIPTYFAIVYKFKYAKYNVVNNYYDDYAELKATNLTYAQLLIRNLAYDTYDDIAVLYGSYNDLDATGMSYIQLTHKEDKG